MLLVDEVGVVEEGAESEAGVCVAIASVKMEALLASMRRVVVDARELVVVLVPPNSDSEVDWRCEVLEIVVLSVLSGFPVFVLVVVNSVVDVCFAVVASSLEVCFVVVAFAVVVEVEVEIEVEVDST